MSESLSKMFKGRNLFVMMGGLYLMLWVVDAEKAQEVFQDVVGIGKSIILNFPSKKPASATSAASDPIKLKTFLTNPNKELLKIRQGRYNQPAGYYIEVDSHKGTCIAKYSEAFKGRWTTPAKILCPQIKEFWSKETHIQK